MFQQEANGDWYVNLRDGELETGGPAADCSFQVTGDPKAAFKFYLPRSLAEKSAAFPAFSEGLAGLAPSGSGLAAMEPSEAWVAEWHDSVSIIYETEE